MNNENFEDFRNCLLGMVVAESTDQFSIGEVTRAVLKICHALVDSKNNQELFIKSLSSYLSESNDTPSLVVVSSLPIGLYNSELPSVIEWARDAALLSGNDPVVTVSSAAVALMGFLAQKEVPVGLWGNELCTPLAGLGLPPRPPQDIPPDDVFLESIMRATLAAGSNLSSYPGSEAVHEVVGAALFGCMSSPDDFELAVSLARESSGVASACITGGLMAIRLNGVPSHLYKVAPSIQKLIADVSKAL